MLGKILGDGHLHKTRGQLVIDQSLRDYTVWNQKKCVELNIGTTAANIHVVHRVRKDKETGLKTETTSYRYQCRSLFKHWRKYFYKEKVPGDPTYGSGDSIYRKCLPEQLPNWMCSPIALAVLYMDDGGIDNGGFAFAPGELPKEEIYFLRDIIATNYGLTFTPLSDLRLTTSSNADFLRIVGPIINDVPCMHYKLKI